MGICLSPIHTVKSNCGSNMSDENLESEMRCAGSITPRLDFEGVVQKK